ncbi:MAG TPA: hypothetical protein ACFE0H_09750 [Elainellaceae cyanobacterium]
MQCLPYRSSPALDGEATSPLLIASPTAQPKREPLRHILLGSTNGVQSTINHLHVLGYVEQRLWSPLLQVPETGIIITPEQGDVMSYLVRWRSRV